MEVLYLYIKLYNSIEKIPSSGANSSPTSQKVPRILWDPEVKLPHSQLPAILILSSDLRLGLPGLPTKTSRLPYVLHALQSHYSRLDNSNIWWIQITKPLVMPFSQLPYHLVRLRPQHLPQHPILEQPQTIFHPPCERPSFTPIQNNAKKI